MHNALCYSTTKRGILAEKEASRTPVKIACFTRTADHTKLVVNDITHVMAPNSLECPFQFCQNPDDQTTTTLEKLDEALEDKLTIFCKVLKLGETKIVGQRDWGRPLWDVVVCWIAPLPLEFHLKCLWKHRGYL